MLDYPIAREIGHQFDSVGITYPLSEKPTILTNDDASIYHEMKNCGTDKYSYQMSQSTAATNYEFMVCFLLLTSDLVSFQFT